MTEITEPRIGFFIISVERPAIINRNPVTLAIIGCRKCRDNHTNKSDDCIKRNEIVEISNSLKRIVLNLILIHQHT